MPLARRGVMRHSTNPISDALFMGILYQGFFYLFIYESLDTNQSLLIIVSLHDLLSMICFVSLSIIEKGEPLWMRNLK